MTSKTIPTEERVSDEDLARAVFYYGNNPNRTWGRRMVSMLVELQSRRSQPTREAVIEECAKVAEACSSYYSHEGAVTAKRIRALKSPSAKE